MSISMVSARFRNVACLIGVPLSLGIDDRQGNSFPMTRLIESQYPER